jgi:hypothetical protein
MVSLLGCSCRRLIAHRPLASVSVGMDGSCCCSCGSNASNRACYTRVKNQVHKNKVQVSLLLTAAASAVLPVALHSSSTSTEQADLQWLIASLVCYLSSLPTCSLSMVDCIACTSHL